MTVQVKLLRPLDGKQTGEIAFYPDEDARTLERSGSVEIIGAKAAPTHNNKMLREPHNKAAGPRSRKAV